MITLNINGTNYNYPELDDEDWGAIATTAMEAMATLTASLRNPSDPQASEGQIRLGNGDGIAWRNANADGNIKIFVSDDDQLYWTDGNTVISLTASADGNVTGPANGATDKAVVRFDQSTGLLIQNSSAILSDSGTLNLAENLNAVDVTASSNLVGDAGTLNTLDVTNVSVTNIEVDNLTANNPILGDLTGDVTGNVAGNVTGNLTGDVVGNLSGGNVDALALTCASIDATSANIVANARTRSVNTTVGAGGVAISNGSGSYSTTNTAYNDATNLAVTITVVGRPVHVQLIADENTAGSYLSVGKNNSNSSAQIGGYFEILRDNTAVCENILELIYPTDTSTFHNTVVPLGSVSFVDNPGAGTYTYKLRVKTFANSIVVVEHAKLVAYEL